MNAQEKKFVESIQNKINKYEIPITLKDAFKHASGILTKVVYADNTFETVDSGIECYLMTSSFAYWLDNFSKCDIPNKGTVKFQPYYYQLEMAKEIGKYRKIVVDKTRQCLTVDNYIMTNRGLISIADAKIGDLVETIKDGQIEFTPILDYIPQGKRKVMRILTNSGKSLILTPDHKVLTERGWVEAKDLTISDEVVPLKEKPFGNFSLEDDKLAKLIGYYIADGKYNSPTFVNTNLNYINEVVEAGQLFENCEPWIYERKPELNRLQGYDVYLTSKNNKNSHLYRPIKQFMHRFGLDVKSSERCLTDELMNLNKHQMTILLNRLYAGDGWITHKKANNRPNYIAYEIGFGSPCYKLIKQIEYILQNQYGIYGWIQKCVFGGNDFWKYRVTQKKSVIKFVNEIGIYGKTDREEYKELLAKEHPYNTNQSQYKISKIEDLEEEQEVFDITTETHDFLANGLMVHNCGMSTVFSLYCFWRLQVFPSDCISVISLTQLKAKDFILKFKTTMDCQPPFFIKKCIENNKQKMRFEHPNGEISTITSESSSPSAGRSSSLSFLVLDEIAFYKSAELVQSILAAASPTLVKTGGSLCLISTPNGGTGEGQPGSYYYNQVQEAKMGIDKDTKYLKINWWQIPDDPDIPGPKRGFNKQLNQAIAEGYYNNVEVRKKWEKYFEQFEKNPNDNPFLRSQLSNLGEFKFRQEILGEFIISGNRALTPDVMTKIKSRLKDPIMKDYLCLNGQPVKQMNNFWIWKHPTEAGKFSVNCDPSSGSGQDRACIQVLDLENMEQVAEFYGFVSTVQLPEMIKDIARVYNNAYVIIEANSIGDSVFNGVFYDKLDPYTNCYKQKKTNNGVTRFTGWITDVKSRKLITSELYDWLTNPEMFEKLHIYSERVYGELETWILDDKGKFIHASSCHDDSLMALALGLYNRNKSLQNVSDNVLGFVDEDGTIINYDRDEYNKKLESQRNLNGTVLRSDSHQNELSAIMNDGRKKLSLNDTNYAGIYSNTEDFGTNTDFSQLDRAVRERYGLSGADVYNWLIS